MSKAQEVIKMFESDDKKLKSDTKKFKTTLLNHLKKEFNWDFEIKDTKDPRVLTLELGFDFSPEDKNYKSDLEEVEDSMNDLFYKMKTKKTYSFFPQWETKDEYTKEIQLDSDWEI